jgi:hypothetical protein
VKNTYFTITLVYFTWLVSCGQLKNNKTTTSHTKETNNMAIQLLMNTGKVKMGEWVHFPWNQPDGLPKIITGAPITSRLHVGTEEPDPVIANYRFRFAESENKIIILSNDPVYTLDYSSDLVFTTCNIENKKIEKISVPMGHYSIEKTEIIDFLLDKNNHLFLLEHRLTKQNTKTNRLRCINSEGKIIWEIESVATTGQSSGQGVLPGNCIALIKTLNNIIYIHSELNGKASIIKINATNSKPEGWLNLDHNPPKVFIRDSLSVNYIAFINEKNNRALVRYESAKETKEIKYAGKDAYALLAFPAAADQYNNIYCAEGLSFSCLSPELLVKWVFTINNIIKKSDQLFSGYYHSENRNLQINKWQANGDATGVIKIPLDIAGLRMARLSGLTRNGDFIIETYQGENKQNWIFNTVLNKLEKMHEQAPFSSFTLQAAATWQIDKYGNLYIPVNSEAGLDLIKVTISSEN